MLERLHQIAIRLIAFKPLVIFGILLFSILTMISLITTNPESDSFLNASILGTIWTLLLYSFLQLFQSIPRLPDASDGFFKSIIVKIKRGLYFLLSLAIIMTTIALLWMSFRLILL
jgi:hypothetical protein